MSDSLWPYGLQHARLSHPSLYFAQTHVCWVSEAIQSSRPLSPFSPALSLSQHHGLFQWVSSMHQVAKVSEFQHQSFQWIFRVDFLEDWLVWSPCCPRVSQESSPAPQFESTSSSVLSLLYGSTLTSPCDPMDGSTPGFPVFHYLPVCSNWCPLSQWCHPTISSYVAPFCSCPQSFLASGSFPMSQLFTASSQSVGASAWVFLMNIQDWFPLGLTALIFLLSKGFSRVFSSTTVWKHQFFGAQPSFWSNSHMGH